MTPGCGSVKHSMAQAYTPKAKNMGNPFSAHTTRPGKKMNSSSAASMFYGTPAVKTSFKIGKY